MIFRLDKSRLKINPVKRIRLADIGLLEINLQELLFADLGKMLPNDELLLIMKSVKWREEPDLMAIDNKGDLYIFELKAWESHPENLLQVMRYGQIYGQYDYEKLNELFKKFYREKELLHAISKKFYRDFREDEINRRQHFIVITNGLDFDTRQAVLYWKDKGLDVRSWIYRLYIDGDNEVLFEINMFRKKDDPYEDIEEGYYILNTNRKYGDMYEKDMIENQKVAAYWGRWKEKILRLKKGDRVFLYGSGTGIIAMGIASGKVEVGEYGGEMGEQYFMKLNNFKKLKSPLTPSEIKEITGVNYVFMHTMFAIYGDSGDKLWNYMSDNCI